MTERGRRLPLPGGIAIARRILGATGLLGSDRTKGASSASPAEIPSFQTVYRNYFDFVWSSAARLGVAPSAMDDVVQEVFIVIHARLHTLQDPSALRSWIYGVVRRTASSHRRAQRGRDALNIDLRFDETVRSSSPTPLEQTERSAELALLTNLLSELDEPKREVFALVELQELTVREAAELLEIPLNTAASRLRLARQAFEAALARYHARSRGK